MMIISSALFLALKTVGQKADAGVVKCAGVASWITGGHSTPVHMAEYVRLTSSNAQESMLLQCTGTQNC